MKKYILCLYGIIKWYVKTKKETTSIQVVNIDIKKERNKCKKKKKKKTVFNQQSKRLQQYIDNIKAFIKNKQINKSNKNNPILS